MARSIKKGPFVASYIIKKIDEMNCKGEKNTIKYETTNRGARSPSMCI